MTTGQAPAPEAAALSRELADFLIEFSIALHKNAIYPPGHPLLEQAGTGLLRRAASLLSSTRPTLSIGVARRQLIIEGVATDANHPLLRDLAQRLHRHHIGAVRFTTGLDEDELARFLATVAVDAGRMELPLGLQDPEVLQQWEHARLYPLSFEQLELLDDGGEDDLAAEGKGGARAAQLWIGLARAAMAADAVPDEELPAADPVLVAKAIDEHGKDVAYDQVVVGYLLQIAEELKRKQGKEAVALQKRISRVVESLAPETLHRLLEMGGDTTQRNRFVLDASAGMSVDAVMDLLRAAADTSAQTVSHSMVRLLSKFAAHADLGAQEIRPEADSAVREHVQRLIGEWSLDDPNPDAYRLALEGMARATPLFPGVDRHPCEPERMVAMALEMGAVGEAVWRALDELTARQALGPVLAMLAAAEDGWARRAILERVATQDRLHAMLQRSPLDVPVIDALAGFMGHAAMDPLLDALEIAPDERATRELVELLVAHGAGHERTIARRLQTARWAALRPILVVLGRLPQWPADFSPADWARHPDDAVRREALRMMLKDERLRDDGIRLGIGDTDAATLRLVLGAAMTGGVPDDAVPPAMERALDPALPAELRAIAVRVVAGSRSPAVAPWLAGLCLGKKRLFRQRLAERTPEMLAALDGLAAFWRTVPQAQPVIALALKSRDAEVREIVSRRRSQLLTPHSSPAVRAGEGARPSSRMTTPS